MILLPARNLGMAVVIEGVREEALAAPLGELGNEYGQGWVLLRPASLESELAAAKSQANGSGLAPGVYHHTAVTGLRRVTLAALLLRPWCKPTALRKPLRRKGRILLIAVEGSLRYFLLYCFFQPFLRTFIHVDDYTVFVINP